MTEPLTPRQRLILLLTAVAGFAGLNGFFMYRLVFHFDTFWSDSAEPMAVIFLADALGATLLLCWQFARRPPGRYGWKTFLALSLLGGLIFSLPALWLLNDRAARPV